MSILSDIAFNKFYTLPQLENQLDCTPKIPKANLAGQLLDIQYNTTDPFTQPAVLTVKLISEDIYKPGSFGVLDDRAVVRCKIDPSDFVDKDFYDFLQVLIKIKESSRSSWHNDAENFAFRDEGFGQADWLTVLECLDVKKTETFVALSKYRTQIYLYNTKSEEWSCHFGKYVKQRSEQAANLSLLKSLGRRLQDTCGKEMGSKHFSPSFEEVCGLFDPEPQRIDSQNVRHNVFSRTDNNSCTNMPMESNSNIPTTLSEPESTPIHVSTLSLTPLDTLQESNTFTLIVEILKTAFSNSIQTLIVTDFSSNTHLSASLDLATPNLYNAHFSQCALAIPLFPSLGPVQKVMESGLVLVMENVKFRKSKYNGQVEAILPNAGALVYDWTKEVEAKYAKDYEMFKKRRAVYVEEYLDSLGGVPIGYDSVPDISNVLQDGTNLKLVREPVDGFTIKQEPVDDHENNLIAFSSLDPVDEATSVECPGSTNSQIPDTSNKRTHSGSTTDVDLPDAPVPKRKRTQFIAKGRILAVDQIPPDGGFVQGELVKFVPGYEQLEKWITLW